MSRKRKSGQKNTNEKVNSLETFREDGAGEFLTTNQGVRINEKMTHFDHERIPERIVHARGERRGR